MNIQDAVATCFAKYATFSGRASRSEFWWFWLASTVFGWLAIVAGNSLGQGVGQIWNFVYSIFLFSPFIAAGARRLHDTGRSGWWQLLTLTIIGLVPLLYWLAQPSQPGPNQYGEEPETGSAISLASPIPPSAHSEPAPQSAPTADTPHASAAPTNERVTRRGMMDWARPETKTAAPPPHKPTKAKGMSLFSIFIIVVAVTLAAYYLLNSGILSDLRNRLESGNFSLNFFDNLEQHFAETNHSGKLFFKQGVEGTPWIVLGARNNHGTDLCTLVQKMKNGDTIALTRLIGEDEELALELASSEWSFRNYGENSSTFQTDASFEVAGSNFSTLQLSAIAQSRNAILIPRLRSQIGGEVSQLSSISALASISLFGKLFVDQGLSQATDLGERFLSGLAESSPPEFDNAVMRITLKDHEVAFSFAGLRQARQVFGECLDAAK